MPSLTPRIDDLNSYVNLMINGNMDFWQRGASGNSANNASFFLADRWRVQNTMTSNVAVARSTDVPTLAQSGFNSLYSMSLTNAVSPASPSSSFVNIRYVVEGSDYALIHSQICRLQFWVKSSLVGTYSIKLSNNDDTRTYITTYSISQANTWEKKTIDITMDSSGTWLFDNGAGLRITYALFAPAANQTSNINSWQSANNWASTSQANWAGTASATFQLAQVMLVPGSYSSSAELKFKRAGRSIGDELRMCQRYYEKSLPVDTTPGTVTGIGSVTISSVSTSEFSSGTVSFKVEKRSNPTTVIVYNNNNGNDNQVSEYTLSPLTFVANRVITYYTPHGTTSFKINGNGQLASGRFYDFHWAANAEL